MHLGKKFLAAIFSITVYLQWHQQSLKSLNKQPKYIETLESDNEISYLMLLLDALIVGISISDNGYSFISLVRYSGLSGEHGIDSCKDKNNLKNFIT